MRAATKFVNAEMRRHLPIVNDDADRVRFLQWLNRKTVEAEEASSSDCDCS